MNESTLKMIADLQRQSDAINRALQPTREMERLRVLMQEPPWLSTHRAMLESFKHNSGIELALEKTRSLTALGLMPRELPLLRSGLDDTTLRALEAASASLIGRFRLPELPEIDRLSKLLAGSGVTSHLSSIEHSLKAIRAPWIDSLDPTGSLERMTRLAALGDSVRALSFDPTVLSSIEHTIGRWRDIPNSLLTDSLGRENYFIRKGFDKTLIALPEPAFTESLAASSVLDIELLAPNSDSEEFDIEAVDLSEEEAHLFHRATRAFRLLSLFERKFREYVHDVMTGRYGPGWETGRAPENGKVCEKWVQKRDTAAKNGEEPLDLIHYADFTDYAKLVRRKDNWKDLFSAVFRDEEELGVAFRRIEKIRIVAMHNRTVTKSDLLTLGLETTLILSAIGVVKKG